MFEKILNKLGYYKRISEDSYREICYLEPGTPEKNNERLLRLTADGHGWIQERTEEDYQFIGTFFTLVLLIEYKLSQLLIGFDPDIEKKTLGRKIDVYKDFIKIYRFEASKDISNYRNLISPLKGIVKLRNAMAHDITKSKFTYKDIKQIEQYASRMRPDLFNTIKDCENEDVKSMGLIAIFGFIFAFEIAKLRMTIA